MYRKLDSMRKCEGIIMDANVFSALSGSSGQVPVAPIGGNRDVLGVACILEDAQMFRVGTEKRR